MSASEAKVARNERVELVNEAETELERDERIKECLQDAEEMKQEGNAHFRQEEWTQALVKYQSGLGRLPIRPAKRQSKPAPLDRDGTDSDAEEVGPSSSTSKPKLEPDGDEEASLDVPLQGLDLECAKARAVLNANIGACHLKLKEYKAAVEVCSEALVDDPHYIKALQRRASCNELIGSWSSLSSAHEDYNKLLKLFPPNSSQIGPTRRAIEALKPRIEEAQRKETGEVMDKLKGLGNNILGNFGLSTDNFQFTPNGQGGYSMNFVR